jgi:hypothetical protein
VVSFREYTGRPHAARRNAGAPAACRQVREGIGEVRKLSSFGLDAATIALPADIDVRERADRMSAFWRALVEYQHRGVIVVAICVGDER